MNSRNKGRKKLSSKPLKWFSSGNCSDWWAEMPVARQRYSVVPASLHIQRIPKHFFQDFQFCLLTLSDPEMVHSCLCCWYASRTSHYPKVLPAVTYSVKPLDSRSEKRALCRSYALVISIGKFWSSFTFALWFILLSIKMTISLLALWGFVMEPWGERKEHWDLVDY